MAEPVVTKDLEDVVSSVRRLVAPEASPRPMSRDLNGERLILTPALRVVTDDAPQPAKAVVETDVDVASAPAEHGVPAPDELAFVVAPQETPGEPVPQSEHHMHEGGGEWDDVFWSEAGKSSEAVSAVDAAIEPATAQVRDQAGQLEITDGPEWAAAVEEASSESPADSVVQFPQFAEARASLMGRNDSFADGMEPLSGLTDADGNPVTVIDEAALHDIVRSLIREELQGVLGEKITQNVRKLVRAEINRALTARSLD